ncbi:hypothetical protein [Nocardioides flavescens]|uniref:Uncharacterized protein n=1 Tax=Nocardioides flavescens TaxID=2691959 RepID=A0A6L7EVH7_9ACTN|nr:hypothetical protein [Nocardioides flavescens]MXG90720.1 hypothetical protein [Nocardioides flavescens]
MTRLVARALPAAVLLLGGAVAGGCGDDPQAAYCDAVESHRAELGELLGSGGPDALLRALPVFRDLAAKAPSDLRDEWRTVVDAVEGLSDALDAAGVDAATYDRDSPPAGVTDAQRDAIDAAAGDLTSPATVTAFEGVQQQAKDVCGTPLSL